MIDFHTLIKRAYNHFYMPKFKSRMIACGSDVVFSPYDSHFIYETMVIGNHVSIGYNADMKALLSKIIIKDHVVFGPHVSIRGGDHRTDIVGRYVDSIGDDEKNPENDLDVVFEGDNWIGMNTTILKGVTIGRGCIVAGGALLNKSVPPYSVVGGVPAKVLKWRFSIEQIQEHEVKLYPEEKRYTREQLEKIFEKYKK